MMFPKSMLSQHSRRKHFIFSIVCAFSIDFLKLSFTPLCTCITVFHAFRDLGHTTATKLTTLLFIQLFTKQFIMNGHSAHTFTSFKTAHRCISSMIGHLLRKNVTAGTNFGLTTVDENLKCTMDLYARSSPHHITFV